MAATAATAPPSRLAIGGQDLIDLLDNADRGAGDADFAIDLGDGLAMVAVAQLLADAGALQSPPAGADLGAAEALADWLEKGLPREQPDQSSAADADATALFAPFAT